jgi:hypothetical protein
VNHAPGGVVELPGVALGSGVMVLSGIVPGLVVPVRPDLFVRLDFERSSIGVALVVVSGVVVASGTVVVVLGLAVVVLGLVAVVLGLEVVALGLDVVELGTVVVPPGGVLCADGVATCANAAVESANNAAPAVAAIRIKWSSLVSVGGNGGRDDGRHRLNARSPTVDTIGHRRLRQRTGASGGTSGIKCRPIAIRGGRTGNRRSPSIVRRR